MAFGRFGMGAGFGRMGRGVSGARPPLVLPGSPAALISSRQPAGYTGFYGQARKSDGSLLDIGWVNRAPDIATALNFTGAGGTWAKIYDHSGNGNHFLQPTVANQPSISATALVNGVLPVIFDGIYNGVGKSLLIPSSLSLPRNNFSVFQAIRQNISYETQIWYEFTSGATTYISSFLGATPFDTGVMSYDTATLIASGVRPRGLLTTLALRSNASNQIFTVNGTTSTQAASTAQTMNTGGQYGSSIAGAQYNLKADVFALAFYATDIGATNGAAVLSAFNSAFAVPQTFTTRLIYGGSSLISGHLITFNQSGVRKLGLPSNVEIYNFGMTNGQTLATEYANRAIELGMYDATKARNIFVIDAASNDIAAQAAFANAGAATTFATNLYNNTTLPFVTAILATGATAKAVVPTIISRNAFDTTVNFYETARTTYNGLVTGGAVANNYTASDRAGDALLGAQNACQNATYFNTVDHIHPTDIGTSIWAAIDAAAITPLIL